MEADVTVILLLSIRDSQGEVIVEGNTEAYYMELAGYQTHSQATVCVT